MFHTIMHISLAAVLAIALPAVAQTPAETLAVLKQTAAETPGFHGFSTARGEQFFKSTHGSDWSCATCHTDNPAGVGKHTRTGKAIQPLAPAANADRFTDQAKVDKWFKRNCNDVLNRACTPLEKGDVLTYLMSLAK
ncbi:MAG TPA: DUF1924 domain-containing protein [Methylophilaceae bacterium]|nr:DUF1924 domain-containing protein [Methylophilaceae bacterium]HQR60435.1 DUF1924 domain-containing protein [Methylophilaceae bacterium]